MHSQTPVFFISKNVWNAGLSPPKFIDTPKPLTHYKVVASETPIAAITCAGLKQWSHHISQPATAIV